MHQVFSMSEKVTLNLCKAEKSRKNAKPNERQPTKMQKVNGKAQTASTNTKKCNEMACVHAEII